MPPISVLSALADPVRARIIILLRDGPQPVHALASGFPISRPAISRHLRVLKAAGLISEIKQGRENLYRLHLDALEPVRAWLDQFLKPTAPEAPQAEAEPPAPRPRKKLPITQMGFDF